MTFFHQVTATILISASIITALPAQAANCDPGNRGSGRVCYQPPADINGPRTTGGTGTRNH